MEMKIFTVQGVMNLLMSYLKESYNTGEYVASKSAIY